MADSAHLHQLHARTSCELLGLGALTAPQPTPPPTQSQHQNTTQPEDKQSTSRNSHLPEMFFLPKNPLHLPWTAAVHTPVLNDGAKQSKALQAAEQWDALR